MRSQLPESEARRWAAEDGVEGTLEELIKYYSGRWEL